jgi:hypothetical protein
MDRQMAETWRGGTRAAVPAAKLTHIPGGIAVHSEPAAQAERPRPRHNGQRVFPRKTKGFGYGLKLSCEIIAENMQIPPSCTATFLFCTALSEPYI